MKNIKLISINGCWYAANVYSQSLLKQTGLDGKAGFLSYNLLLNHVSKFNINIKVVS